MYYTGDAWLSWQAVPNGATLDAPAAALYGDNLHVVVRGQTGDIWHTVIGSDGTVVKPWTAAEGATPSRPVLATKQGSNTISLVVRGGDDGLWYNDYTVSSDSWDGWTSLPGSTIDGVGAAVYEEDLYVAVRGQDGLTMWFGYMNLGTDVFSGWTLVEGSTPSPPTMVSPP
jgi:hypothetical protein